MNIQHQARFEKKNRLNYSQTLLSQGQATDFLIEMLNIAKENYEESKGTVLEDDYKEAVVRYTRMYQRYLKYLLS